VLPNLKKVIEMITNNLFRSLTSVKKPSLETTETGNPPEEEEVDDTWVHLYGVYQFMFTLIRSPVIETEVFRPYISKKFLQQFLDLFDTEIVEERFFLKLILHFMYQRFECRRKRIRNALTECFYRLIHELPRFNGANELLIFLSSIVKGFESPLRKEHSTFFKDVILPLHKVQTC
jgi:serine/threonine-protein phosphatase 2A regulatory subunit B'